MEMPHSELDTDAPKQPDEELAPMEEDDSSVLEDQHPSRQIDFTRWREEPLPAQATSRIGHRRVVKSGNVRRGESVKITHEVSLEPEPEPESAEVTPLMEGEIIVGLRITCGCGATHEVHFEYSEEH